MKPYLLLLVLSIAFATKTHGQNIIGYKPRLLRFDEDYSKLPDTVRENSWWLRLKNVPINRSHTSRASIGVDYREMYERVEGYDTGGVKDGYWLTRFMAHADVHFGKRWRTFVQLGRGIVAEKSLRIAPVDEDRLFLLNAFAEYRFGKKSSKYIRAGRQELFFGMGRLIAPREGPNIRSTYDGMRAHIVSGGMQADAFFTYTVNNKPGIFDNDALGNNQRLWGVYINKKVSGINADLYYFGFYNPWASYSKQQQRATEMRHSIGSRLYGKLLGAVDYDAELIYQFGSFGNYTIDAFEVDGKLSKEIAIKNSVIKPSVKFGYASGNRSLAGNELNTFNPLFPNLLYYQTAIGIFPANIINPNAGLTWSTRKMALAGGIDFFWRASEQDGLYAPFGAIQFNIGSGKYLGYQLYTKGDYQFTDNLSATVLVSRYYKSDFVKRNIDKRGIDLLLNVLLNFKL